MNDLIKEFHKLDSYLCLKNKNKVNKKQIEKVLNMASYSKKRDFDYLQTQETNKSKYKYKR